MILLKIKILVRRYKEGFLLLFFLKKYTSYLSKTKFRIIKTMGKDGFSNSCNETYKFLLANGFRQESYLSQVALYPMSQILSIRGSEEEFTGDFILKTVNHDVKIFYLKTFFIDLINIKGCRDE